MRFAVFLPNCLHAPAVTQPWEHALSGRDIAGVAQKAEQLCYATVLMPEHYVIPVPDVAHIGDHYLSAVTAQAYIAGATSTITVGSLVMILPLHNPVIAAKSIATLDWLSGGRALTAVGVGHLKPEYDAVGVPFNKRGRIADEYLAAMFELWHSDAPDFEGEFVSFNDVAFGPKPLQKPHPPVWIAGDADVALRRAARFGDGWSPRLTPPEELPARVDYLCSQPGWDDRPFSVFYSSLTTAHNDGGGRVAKHGQSAEQIVDSCGQLAELGVTDTWVQPPPVTGLSSYLDHLSWVAEEVIPKTGQ
jgi:probable F420-dependent oxidoreductase